MSEWPFLCGCFWMSMSHNALLVYLSVYLNCAKHIRRFFTKVHEAICKRNAKRWLIFLWRLYRVWRWLTKAYKVIEHCEIWGHFFRTKLLILIDLLQSIMVIKGVFRQHGEILQYMRNPKSFLLKQDYFKCHLMDLCVNNQIIS